MMDLSHGFHLFRDGGAWCAVGPHYIELVLSPAGFGATKEDAVKALHVALRKDGWRDKPMPEMSSFKVHD
jgi:hypothetical protein